ncbi:MAG: DUF4230 domain-containing protein [Bacteroidota bacterium]
MAKRTIWIVGLIVAFGLGSFVAAQYFYKKKEEVTNAQATVLLKQVEQVCKLVTVEGSFTEIYNEENIRAFTIYMPLPSVWRFSKEAILQVEGKVLVGYDMKNIKIEADSAQKVLRLSNIPEPEILSIDHEIAYRNIEESFFNSFTAKDYTNLNKNAKGVLREKAEESGLLEEAAAQGNQIIDVIRYMAKGAGWTVEYEQAPKTYLN